MLKSQRKRLQDLDETTFLEVAEQICHERLTAFPVFECIKVFCRLTESGVMTYARHANDLGTSIVTACDISGRMKSEERASVVLEALEALERSSIDWPFSPGSSSWLQLEILDPCIRVKGPINSPEIVFRRAVRLSSAGSKESVTTSPLVEKMFLHLENTLPESAGRFKFTFVPSLRLKNIAGLGVMTEIHDNREVSDLPELVETLVSKVLSENSSLPVSENPGVFIRHQDEEYRVVSDSYYKKGAAAIASRLPPLPVGFMK